MALAPGAKVVKGSDTTKLKYKLTNIQLEYEMIHSKELAEEASSVYESGKAFIYDHVARDRVHTIKKETDTKIKHHGQRSKKILERAFTLVYRALQCGNKGFRKIHLS